MPLDPDIERQFQVLFDAHDAAAAGLRTTHTGLAAAMAGLSAALAANDEAIGAVLKATHGAVDLLRRLSNGGGS